MCSCVRVRVRVLPRGVCRCGRVYVCVNCRCFIGQHRYIHPTELHDNYTTRILNRTTPTVTPPQCTGGCVRVYVCRYMCEYLCGCMDVYGCVASRGVASQYRYIHSSQPHSNYATTGRVQVWSGVRVRELPVSRMTTQVHTPNRAARQVYHHSVCAEVVMCACA